MQKNYQMCGFIIEKYMFILQSKLSLILMKTCFKGFSFAYCKLFTKDLHLMDEIIFLCFFPVSV